MKKGHMVYRDIIISEGVDVIKQEVSKRNSHIHFYCRYMGCNFKMIASCSTSDNRRGKKNFRADVRRKIREIDSVKTMQS